MTGERLELNDMGRCNSETKLTEGKKFPWGGCYLSTALGFVLVLLAVLIAVGVGVVVYFAAGREVVCKCGGLDFNHQEEVRGQCRRLAVDGDADVCGACPGQVTSSLTTPTPKKTQTPVENVRLPSSLYPSYYDLELQPLMYKGSADEFSFRGHVRIVLDCREATNVITLHINMLSVVDKSVTLTPESPAASSSSSSRPVVTSWQEDKELQFLRIHLDRDLRVGEKYAVALNFTGPLKDDLHGLYLSSYERGNDTVYLATTQFQPTDARKAFPCFDEPAIKSHFNVTLVRPAFMSSLSNTPVKDSSRSWTEDGIDWVADVYETTPKMSTYLLAFVISDFVSLSDTTANNVTYRVWARPESIEQARYALEVGVKVLTFFEEYYNIPYPLPKQDMIAIPDFSAGAMENWGLITYRETAMLYQPGVSSEGDKQRVAVVVTHELAHQWFGDLVTPSWWDDLWLNEGFASYMEYVGVHFVHPDWKMFDQFVVEDLHDVFDFDGLVTSHPIYVPVYHPDEINEIFDRISYGKGACVIAMMQHFLGEHTFKTALTNYLRETAYDAAFHNDLWAAMTKQAQMDGKNLDVKAIMDTWTLQMNYPIVTLTQLDKDSVKVTQMRYLRDRSAPDPGKYASPFNYTWDVPITLTSSVERNFNKTDADVHWFWKSSPELILKLPGHLPRPDRAGGTGWILGNVQLHGYYRVSYDHHNWRALFSSFFTDHKVMTVLVSRSRGNYLPMEIALQTVEYLHNELDYVAWAVASDQLSYVDMMLSRTALYLQLSLNPKEIRKQDALKIIGSISGNTIGRALAWDFFRGHWDRLRAEHGASFFSFSALVGAVTYSFNTEFELQQLQEFIQKHPDQGSGRRAFQQAVEKTRSNIAWMDKNYDILSNWLHKQSL
ncbi:LOW QUALITY PROTEIN: aminopeptidase N-like [Babylonia areolata]|uniref:LOW QUALITY PROTEIN: aminopeptidase N-like n=1 Tax=Babylonia areolata TaxID=304850 RepID=UPI003FD04ED8